MKVAIDMDDTITKTSDIVAKLIKEEYKIDYQPDMQFEWRGEKALKHYFGLEMPQGEFLDFCYQAWDHWKEIEFTCITAQTICEDLEKEGFEVDILTFSGDEEVHENKQRYIDTFMTGDPNLVNVNDGSGQWKYDLDYDVFIDDCPYVIIGAVSKDKKSILIDRSYNRGIPDAYIWKRVPNLDPVLNILKDLDWV